MKNETKLIKDINTLQKQLSKLRKDKTQKAFQSKEYKNLLKKAKKIIKTHHFTNEFNVTFKVKECYDVTFDSLFHESTQEHVENNTGTGIEVSSKSSLTSTSSDITHKIRDNYSIEDIADQYFELPNYLLLTEQCKEFITEVYHFCSAFNIDSVEDVVNQLEKDFKSE